MEDQETTVSEDTEIETSEAGTVTGKVGDSGTQENDIETEEQPTDTTNNEALEGTEEQQQSKGPDSLPLNERVTQLLGRVEEKSEQIQRLEAKLATIEQTTAPSFPELPYSKINDYVNQTLNQIEELKLNGEPLKALDLQDGLNNLRKEIKDYEQKRNEHLSQSSEVAKQTQAIQQIDQQLVAAAELVRKEDGITQEVWDAGAKFFENARKSNPLVEAQFRETVLMRGPIAGLLWAKEYIQKNMGQQLDAATKKKEAGKGIVPGGKTATTKAAVKDYKSMTDEEFDAELNRVKFGS